MERNKIFIGSDHAGFSLKEDILNSQNNKYAFEDLGCYSDESVDYNDYADLMAQKINENNFGILICSTGIGMNIAANRHKNIRAALCFNNDMVKFSRLHNNANVLVLGSKIISYERAIQMIEIFLSTQFSNEERHVRRILKL